MNGDVINGTYDVVFNNTYHSAPVYVDVQKDIADKSGRTDISYAGFQIQAFEANADWTLKDETPDLTVASDAAGEARFYAAYDKADTYYYVVREVDAGVNGWTYSKAEYHVTIVVTEETDGNLVASITIVGEDLADGESASYANNSGSISFKNTYDPDDDTVDLNAIPTVIKKFNTTADRPLVAGEFQFAIFKNGEVRFNADGTVANLADAITTGTNLANGNVQFEDTLEYTTVGKFEYDVVELKGSLPGVTYDSTIFDLVVEVTDNSGTLEADYYFEDSTTKQVTFTNTYAVKPVEYTISGIKSLTGRAMSAEEFTFALYSGTDTTADPIDTAKNATGGSFSFDAISYTEAGKYVYTVKELEGRTPGIQYDLSTSYKVTVTVTDNKDGTLSVSADVDNANIKFNNIYTANKATLQFLGTKTLVGAENDLPASEQFSFALYRTDHTFNTNDTQNSTQIGETVKNDSTGKYAFPAIDYTATGIYFYVIREIKGTDADIVYDGTEYRFRVVVSDVGDGQLRLAVDNLTTGASITTGSTYQVAQMTADYTNAKTDEVTEKTVYLDGNTTTMIDGSEVNAGEKLTYFISYTNYNGVTTTVDILDRIPAHTTYVEGSASHNGSFAGEHVNWVLTVAPGETVTVHFQVEVTDTGAIIATTADVRDGVNAYSTNEVHNHTVEDPLSKTVADAETPSVSIDGNQVEANDELLYTIRYINASGDKVTVSIEDLIPDNTTYVEGSADYGGVYADGKLTWTLEVEAWQTASVSFKVKVNEDAEDAIIKNAATAKVGTNTYTSNEVVNHTVDDPASKDVFYSSDTTSTSIDGKKVENGDSLTYNISFINTKPEKVTVTIEDVISAHTVYVAGSADKGGVYADGKLTWTLEVEAWQSVSVSFKVTVSNTEDVFVENQAVVKEGTNTYTTNEIVNHTYDEELVKDVFQSDAPAVSIDGKKVSAGDELVYTISYTNTTGAAAQVSITDTIPQNTTYVEDSADNGGVYASGKLSWSLEVETWQTVTVSFKVKVNENAEDVLIKNEATAKVGTNTYTSNEVVNHTVDDPASKDVFHSSDAASASIDGKKVKNGDSLTYLISFVNTKPEKVTVTIEDVIPAHTVYVTGSADKGGVYADGKLTWTLEVEAWQSVTVSFKVTVSSAVDVFVENQAVVKEGSNTYTTNEIVNYTYEEKPVKDVFLSNAPAVSVDGKEVTVGDELVYTISYTNTTGAPIQVSVIDTIPQNTTYVEGSADHGGVYADGKLTWTLSVDPQQTVTVSFKVKVSDAGKEITNQAAVQLGQNSFSSNEVTNTVKADESPKTGDVTILWPCILLMTTSASALTTVVTLGKKKKENDQ